MVKDKKRKRLLKAKKVQLINYEIASACLMSGRTIVHITNNMPNRQIKLKFIMLGLTRKGIITRLRMVFIQSHYTATATEENTNY